MNNYIKVVIKDDNGLCDVLLREGYSQAWIEQGKQIIVRQFKKTANRVFSHILDKYPPHTIWVGFKLDNTDDIFGKKRLVGASHYSVGDGTELFFELSKDLVKSVLEKGNHEGFKHLISHEMFHAADKKMIIANYKLVDAVQRSLHHDVEHRDSLAALYEMLYVLYHFRDEGLAELGACMIGKQSCHVGLQANRLSTSQGFRLVSIRCRSCARRRESMCWQPQTWFRAQAGC